MIQAKALELLQAGRNVFLTGPAGSGKTYLLNQFIRWLKQHKKKVAVTASTGIAATHLGGITIHSWSGIGINDQFNDWQLDTLLQNQKLYYRLTKTDVLIIDEISMLDAMRLDLVDRVLRTIRKNSAAFGGMQVVLCGDFFQLPPIRRDHQPVRFAFEAVAWQQLSDLAVCYLDLVFRHSNDPLLNILNEIRQGELSEDSLAALQDRLEVTVPDAIIPTRVYTHNVDVDAVNQTELDRLVGEVKIFQMTQTGNHTQIEILKKSCLAPEILQLKVGAAVMCLKNNIKQGYANGTLGTVIHMVGETVTIQTITGKEITIYRDTWMIERDGKTVATITQLPLRLAWAITVHKSQGMTLDTIEVDLSKSFAPGMGYVALSRVRSLSGLYLRGINQRALVIDSRVQAQDKIFLTQQSC